MKNRFFLSGLILFLLIGQSFSQDIFRTRTGFFSAGDLQLKERANFGTVFSGPSLGWGRRITAEHKTFSTVYEFELGLATPVSHTIMGVNFHLKPVDFMIGVNINLGDIRVVAGPAFRIEYNLQFYPDLQSGYDYWLTELSCGLGVKATLPVGPSVFEVKLRNSVTGLVCRNKAEHDPYFLDLNFLAILRDVHQNGRTFHPGDFTSTNLEIEYRWSETSRLSVAYCMDYNHFRNDPSLSMLNQTIRLYIKPRF